MEAIIRYCKIRAGVEAASQHMQGGCFRYIGDFRRWRTGEEPAACTCAQRDRDPPGPETIGAEHPAVSGPCCRPGDKPGQLEREPGTHLNQTRLVVLARHLAEGRRVSL